jgi:hypothetical protein
VLSLPVEPVVVKVSEAAPSTTKIVIARMSSLFAGNNAISPWITNTVSRAILGECTPPRPPPDQASPIQTPPVPHSKPKLVQVGNLHRQQPSGRLWFDASDGSALILVVPGDEAVLPDSFQSRQQQPQEKQSLHNQVNPQLSRGCVVRITSWVVSSTALLRQQHKIPAPGTRTPPDALCLYVTGRVEFLGGIGMGIVGTPIPVHATIDVRRALQSLSTARNQQHSSSSNDPSSILHRNLLRAAGITVSVDPVTVSTDDGSDLPIGDVALLFAGTTASDVTTTSTNFSSHATTESAPVTALPLPTTQSNPPVLQRFPLASAFVPNVPVDGDLPIGDVATLFALPNNPVPLLSNYRAPNHARAEQYHPSQHSAVATDRAPGHCGTAASGLAALNPAQLQTLFSNVNAAAQAQASARAGMRSDEYTPEPNMVPSDDGIEESEAEVGDDSEPEDEDDDLGIDNMLVSPEEEALDNHNTMRSIAPIGNDLALPVGKTATMQWDETIATSTTVPTIDMPPLESFRTHLEEVPAVENESDNEYLETQQEEVFATQMPLEEPQHTEADSEDDTNLETQPDPCMFATQQPNEPEETDQITTSPRVSVFLGNETSLEPDAFQPFVRIAEGIVDPPSRMEPVGPLCASLRKRPRKTPDPQRAELSSHKYARLSTMEDWLQRAGSRKPTLSTVCSKNLRLEGDHIRLVWIRQGVK